MSEIVRATGGADPLPTFLLRCSQPLKVSASERAAGRRHRAGRSSLPRPGPSAAQNTCVFKGCASAVHPEPIEAFDLIMKIAKF